MLPFAIFSHNPMFQVSGAGKGHIEDFQPCKSPLWSSGAPSQWSEVSVVAKCSKDQKLAQPKVWWISNTRKWRPPHKCAVSKPSSLGAFGILSSGVVDIHNKQKWGDHQRGNWWNGKIWTFWSIVASCAENWREWIAWKASPLVWNERRRVAACGESVASDLLCAVNRFCLQQRLLQWNLLNKSRFAENRYQTNVNDNVTGRKGVILSCENVYNMHDWSL